MKDFFERTLTWMIGFVASGITWELISTLRDAAITLVIALMGGFMAHVGKMMAVRYYKKREKRRET